MSVLTQTRPVPAPAPPLAAPRRRLAPVAAQALLWAYAMVALAPLALMLLNSLRTTGDIAREPVALPVPPVLESYAQAWSQASFDRYFWNSLLVTVCAVLLGTAVSVLAAYPLGRYAFPGSRLLAAYFIAGLMLPIRLSVVPIFYLLDALGLNNSLLGLILLYAASGVPFSVFVLTAFFRQLPAELAESARIDGAGEFRIFGQIMLPLIRPAVATVVIFQFVPLWNEFLFPLVLMTDKSKWTIPVGLSSFFGEYGTQYGPMYAGLVIATVPLVVLFLLATKQVVAGLTAGMSR
ncbi:Binding-protein-dependent transport systems inner membrane component [Carbonactinospora thermoautotrophica]|uniref:Binding-protein-dependent transport systems inner membrane component n=1 Tax=Carbonactinospora thermoautotrophica TaxID=1469144 RepID=A0A132MUB1_9ACTN|nr:Binding-protein-dependent transport systems inner membrane component [Carbonactinospora thermoautotrophica]